MNSTLQKWCYILSIKKIHFNIHEMSIGDYLLINFQEKQQVYLIIQGCIQFNKVFIKRNQLTLGILVSGDMINTCKTIKDYQNHFYFMEALSSALVISYNYKKILSLSQKSNLLYNELILAQRQHINKNNKLIQMLSHRDKKHRLINLLLILCHQIGLITHFGIMINLVITHSKLGKIIGSNRTTITRILILLQRKQLLSVYNNKLLVHDPISLSLYH